MFLQPSSEKKFLIIGHPKCGSKYMSRLMYEFGYEVGHEKMAKHGICCWQNVNCLLQFKQCWGPQRIPYDKYTHIIHYVRNPFHAMSSIIVENRIAESYNFRRDLIKHHYGIDLNHYSEVNAAILSYVYYNRLAEGQGVTVRIQVENAYEQLAEYLNVVMPKGSIPTDLNSNGNKLKPVDWDNVSNDMIKLLVDTCERYGYQPF